MCPIIVTIITIHRSVTGDCKLLSTVNQLNLEPDVLHTTACHSAVDWLWLAPMIICFPLFFRGSPDTQQASVSQEYGEVEAASLHYGGRAQSLLLCSKRGAQKGSMCRPRWSKRHGASAPVRLVCVSHICTFPLNTAV